MCLSKPTWFVTWYFCNHVVSIICLTEVIYLVVVLGALGDIAFSQGWYEESLGMYRRLCDILMRTAPKSKEMAIGTLCSDRMSIRSSNAILL